MDKECVSENTFFLPNKDEIKKNYDSFVPVFSGILNNIEQELSDNISLKSKPTFKSRIKSFESYYKKLLRVKKPGLLAESKTVLCLTDMLGIRIICAFLEDLSAVENQLKSLYEITEIEHKGNQNNFKEFGYESVHVLIKIPKSCIPDAVRPSDLPSDLVCEIQIRTILQDAWAEVEHELVYKSEFSPFDMPLRRKLASMNATLSLADIIFQEIRDYQNKLQVEMDERRQSFYFQADELTQEKDGKKEIAAKNIQRVSPYVRGTIDDLVLEALHEHNAGNLGRAIEIYTEILKSSPAPADAVMTVIYKHRGMAYFAKNDYEDALKDFESSVNYDPKGYRSIYYEGIVYTVMESYEKAIDCFTHSISINEYQSHAFYRRALAYYKLKEYNHALADLTSAEKLGLDNEDCKALHLELIKKFDMNM